MNVAELISRLQQFHPETEVQAVEVPGYEFDPEATETDVPIIEVVGNKKDVDYIVIRA